MAQPSFLDESSRDAVINANIVELERHQEEHDSNDESTGNYSTPPKPMDVHMQTPAAPKKPRKAPTTGTRGKQPIKKQKLQFIDNEATGDDDAPADDQSSLGEYH